MDAYLELALYRVTGLREGPLTSKQCLQASAERTHIWQALAAAGLRSCCWYFNG